jgi:hypothetical protein
MGEEDCQVSKTDRSLPMQHKADPNQPWARPRLAGDSRWHLRQAPADLALNLTDLGLREMSLHVVTRNVMCQRVKCCGPVSSVLAFRGRELAHEAAD